MVNLYDATRDDIKSIILLENEDLIYHKRYGVARIEDLVLVRSTNFFPSEGVVKPIDRANNSERTSSNWNLNGLMQTDKDFIIIEPFIEQVTNPSIVNINELDTWFIGDVHLSSRAIIFMSEEKYKELCESNPSFKDKSKDLNINIYRGDVRTAIKMLLYNKHYASFDLDENGFMIADDFGDTLEYIEELKKLEEQIAIELQQRGRHVTYGQIQDYYEEETIANETKQDEDLKNQIEEEILFTDNLEELSARMITGLTPVVEGDISLDGECFASIEIGKVRENQEDAVLLVKDNEIPDFKMMVVADGMGGEQKGEFASHLIVEELKEWFESLDEEQKSCYYTGVLGLSQDLQNRIQQLSIEIGEKLYGLGGATIVCTIVGKYDTLILNVGDSRAYSFYNGKLKQETIDDAIVQEEFEKGKIPFKDAMRFHREAAGITQCVGMGRIAHIHTKVLNNNDYNMLLLLSDGVTDCLSEDDIEAICNTAEKEKVAKVLVRKAIEHDSIAPEILLDYFDFNFLVPGGKDNTTAVVVFPKKDREEMQEER